VSQTLKPADRTVFQFYTIGSPDHLLRSRPHVVSQSVSTWGRQSRTWPQTRPAARTAGPDGS
jgi:hypothetical protein